MLQLIISYRTGHTETISNIKTISVSEYFLTFIQFGQIKSLVIKDILSYAIKPMELQLK